MERYAGRLSGPLLDRLDLTVHISPVPASELSGGEPGEASATVLGRVLAARAAQFRRSGKVGVALNGDLRGRAVLAACHPEAAAVRLLERASERLGLSARGHHRTLAVARTIADLEGSALVSAAHVAEALQYRDTTPS